MMVRAAGRSEHSPRPAPPTQEIESSSAMKTNMASTTMASGRRRQSWMAFSRQKRSRAHAADRTSQMPPGNSSRTTMLLETQVGTAHASPQLSRTRGSARA